MSNKKETQSIFGFEFELDKSMGGGYFSAKLKSINEHVFDIAIYHDSQEGKGWKTYISIYLNKSNDYEYQCTLNKGNEQNTIIEAFEYYNVAIDKKEIIELVDRVKDLVSKTFPRNNAHENYFGI